MGGAIEVEVSDRLIIIMDSGIGVVEVEVEVSGIVDYGE